ncbi:MAG TPA: cysteine desulfurase [Crenotrichaceae bacterium]|nr:cysteine desulfurase [Crenotrichaceae bacterium]
MIYLDHNATTPLDPDVLESMLPFLGNQFGNPSSLSRLGRTARTAIEVAREQVAALAGASASQVIFTSGGTEANNLALLGLSQVAKKGALAISAIEHPSVLSPALDYLSYQGWDTHVLPVNTSGIVDVNTLETSNMADLRLISVMLANNETGVIQDIAGIANDCRKHHIMLHTDAVQAFGKIPVNFKTLHVHSMSVSSHKINGPKGVGALIVDPEITVQPLVYGGGQEKTIRPGTENVAGIIGFGKAAELAAVSLEQHMLSTTQLRDELITRLLKLDHCTIFGVNAPRLPNTVQFAIQNVDGEMLLMALDQAGIAVSSGSACSSASKAPSHVLQAMGVDEITARGAIRISFGSASTTDNIDSLMAVINQQLSSWMFDDE